MLFMDASFFIFNKPVGAHHRLDVFIVFLVAFLEAFVPVFSDGLECGFLTGAFFAGALLIRLTTFWMMPTFCSMTITRDTIVRVDIKIILK